MSRESICLVLSTGASAQSRYSVFVKWMNKWMNARASVRGQSVQRASSQASCGGPGPLTRHIHLPIPRLRHWPPGTGFPGAFLDSNGLRCGCQLGPRDDSPGGQDSCSKNSRGWISLQIMPTWGRLRGWLGVWMIRNPWILGPEKQQPWLHVSLRVN